jgi:4-methyl-5(b-hydroxyethyl)-thiazole monophosphate biosynthesis
VLAANGFIAGASATCYPAFRHVLETHRVHAMNDSVCLYNHLITSQGPGTAISFALELVAVLVGDVKAVEIAEALCFKWER